ncbi:MAG: VanZ family protein [Gammaproteobacteria bacterium]|nr:VanZ family protein [Gammaproteobacteria bacterium]MCP5418851.1 VanZ family protein [Chromatiaceae bacterium]
MSTLTQAPARFSDLLALLWGATIGYLSLVPQTRLPVSPVNDKVEHFAAYLLLAFLALLARRSVREKLLVLLVILLFGAAIEFVQPSFNRQLEVADMAANTGGALSGYALLLCVNPIIRKR